MSRYPVAEKCFQKLDPGSLKLFVNYHGKTNSTPLRTVDLFSEMSRHGKPGINGDPLSWNLTWLCSRESVMLLITCSTRHNRRFTLILLKNSGDQWRLFSASKGLLNVSRDNGLPPNLHAPSFVNDPGQCFVTKIETIQCKLDTEFFDSVTSLFDSVLDDSPSVSVLSFKNITSQNSLVAFYTGFPNYQTMMTLYLFGSW